MSPAGETGWTTVADVLAVLRRRWRSGAYPRRYAAGEPFEPIAVPVRGPRAAELLDRLDEVLAWEQAFRRDCAPGRGRAGLRLETRTVRGRRLGQNELPARVWVDDWEQLFGVLGVAGEGRELDRLLAVTEATLPALRPWAQTHPHQLLELAVEWPRLLAVVAWIAARPVDALYVRQVDVADVDTKFVEVHRLVLADLLDQVLPEDRVQTAYGRADFAARYGFCRRPDYTWLRFLAPQTVLPAPLSEVTLRTAELAELEFGLRQVIIVENEISYLALPDRADTLAIFGSGFALGSVAGLSWLQDKTITYWGDLDTWGLLILNRLRARFPHVTSMLMDTPTLLAHPRQWVAEERPTDLELPHLAEPEAMLYRDLVEDRWGHHVRLEQERIRFRLVREALGVTSGQVSTLTGRIWPCPP